MLFMMALMLNAFAAVPPPATGGGMANEPLVILQGDTPSEFGVHGKGNVYAPDVCVADGQWRMWYGGQGKDGHDRIHLAESRDGRTWEKRGMVLEDKEANHVNDPSVVRVGNFLVRNAGTPLDAHGQVTPFLWSETTGARYGCSLAERGTQGGTAI